MYTYPKTRPPPVSQILQWAGDDFNITLSNIYANLLSPFTDVVCLFLSDFGGLSSIADFIATWLNSFSNRSACIAANVAYEILKTAKCDLIDAFFLGRPWRFFCANHHVCTIGAVVVVSESCEFPPPLRAQLARY